MHREWLDVRRAGLRSAYPAEPWARRL